VRTKRTAKKSRTDSVKEPVARVQNGVCAMDTDENTQKGNYSTESKQVAEASETQAALDDAGGKAKKPLSKLDEDSTFQNLLSFEVNTSPFTALEAAPHTATTPRLTRARRSTALADAEKRRAAAEIKGMPMRSGVDHSHNGTVKCVLLACIPDAAVSSAECALTAEEKYQLAVSLEFGLNNQKGNLSKAITLYAMAAHLGHGKAEARTGAIVLKYSAISSRSSPESWNLAYKLLRRAAEQDNVSAKYQLALCMLQGSGDTRKNVKCAKEKLQKILPELRAQANANYLEVLLHLIDIYKPASVWGMADKKQAFDWVRKAAELGHPVSQLAMAATAAESGDFTLAQSWLDKVKAQMPFTAPGSTLVSRSVGPD